MPSGAIETARPGSTRPAPRGLAGWQWALLALVAAAIVAVGAALTLGVGDDGDGTTAAAGDGTVATVAAGDDGDEGGDDAALVTDDAADTTADAPDDTDEPATTEPPVVSLPPTVAFVRDSSDLVVLDTATGETRTVLSQPEPDPDDPLGPNSFGRVILHPSGEVVFVEEVGEPAAGVVVRVPLRGGEPEPVALGAYPALSADGRFLATADVDGGITVLDLETREPRTIEGPAGALGVSALNLAWGRDGRTLFFERVERTDGSSELWAVDARTATTLDEARRLGPPDGREGWTLPAPRGGGELVVVEQCCTTTGPMGSANGAVVDGTTGTLLATFLFERSVLDANYDSTGTFLLYVLTDGTLRWQGGGQRGELVDGATAADW